MSVSYCVSGRFANNLIQYFAAKVLCRLTGKKFEYNFKNDNQRTIGDIEYISIYNDIKNKELSIEGDILLNEFYQSKEWLFPERDYLISLITVNNNDNINDSYKVKDLANALLSFNNSLNEDELVIHVRLDDYFHQGYNSDVIDPYSLIDLVNSIGFKKNTIVCDKIRHDWEHKYIELLLNNIPNSKVISSSLLEDLCTMYYSKNIIVSRSTFSWIGPILSPYTVNSWFPLRKEKLYPNQTIDRINELSINFTPKYITYKL